MPPERVVDVLALTGDTSDNVPGAEGIGPKTAVKLIREYGSLDQVLAAAEGMKPSKMREALLRDREQVLRARELVTIDRAAPIPFEPEALRMGPIWNAELERLLVDLELFSLRERLRTRFGGLSLPLEAAPGAPPPVARRQYRVDHRNGRTGSVGRAVAVVRSRCFPSTRRPPVWTRCAPIWWGRASARLRARRCTCRWNT